MIYCSQTWLRLTNVQANMLAAILKKFSVGIVSKTFRAFELIFQKSYEDYQRRFQIMITQILLTFNYFL